MPWPVLDHLWRHESYQAPLSSDMISDLISFREPRKRGKHCCCCFSKQNSLNSWCIPLKRDYLVPVTFTIVSEGSRSTSRILRKNNVESSPEALEYIQEAPKTTKMHTPLKAFYKAY